MDKVTCIAFSLYKSSKNPDIREKAIQLLNGEVSIRELKRNVNFQAHIVYAETFIKKNKIDKNQVQAFVEEFMTLEV